MSRSSHLLRPAALAALAAGFAIAVTASRLPKPRAAVAGDPAVAATPSPAADEHGDLHARYAEARLRLAQANLAHAQDLARAIPGQVNDLELASLRRRVDILQRHVAVARQQPHGNGRALAKSAAEAAVRQAEDELAAVRAANARQPATVSLATLRQLEAAVDLARARLAIWEDPSFLDSPVQVMQMQLDQLADEVLELTNRVDNRFSRDRR